MTSMIPDNSKLSIVKNLINEISKFISIDIKLDIKDNISKLFNVLKKLSHFRNEINKMKNDGFIVLITILNIFMRKNNDKKKINLAIELQNSISILCKQLFGGGILNQNSFIETSSFLILLSTVCLVDVNKKFLNQSLQTFYKLWIYLKLNTCQNTNLIASKVMFFYAIYHSKLKLNKYKLRDFLISNYRSTVLNQNESCKIVIINILLQKYLEDGLITEAEKFVVNVTLPENSEYSHLARYSFYIGRINVIQLRYEDALINFSHVIEKITETDFNGFKEITIKYFILTKLLLGEIPNQFLSNQKYLENSLFEYFVLAQVIQHGDIKLFNLTIKRFYQKFNNDGTLMLINRLYSKVINIALRKISESYSRIHLKELALKLNLKTISEASYIVSKNIRDGVFKGIINDKQKILIAFEKENIHSSNYTHLELDHKIKFCLELYQKSIKTLKSCNKNINRVLSN